MAPTRRTHFLGHGEVPRRSRVRTAAILGAAFDATISVATMGVSLAGSATVGDPQPELAQFNLGFAGSGSTASGVVLNSGNLMLVSNGGDSTLTVCVLHPGARTCNSQATLDSFGGDTLYGSAVVSPDGVSVDVIAEDSGTASGTDFPIITWDSSNGGQSFTGPFVVSTLYGVNGATVADGQVVIAANDPHQGLVVQTIDPTGANVQSQNAVVGPDTYVNNARISTYDNGVLIAADDGSTSKVWYAPAGSNFNSAGSYTQVGSFANELVAGLSGNALLTTPSDSISTAGIISFFNGSSFSAAHKVPDSKAGDDGYFSLATTGAPAVPPSTSTAGQYHVFFEGRRNGYDEIEETTANGVSWSSQTMYASSVNSEDPVPVLGPTGSGVVFESDASHQLAQPVLNAQGVVIKFKKARVPVGASDTVTGHTSFHVSGLKVELEERSRGAWLNVKSTHESASGIFSFVVAAKTVTYRAVVADDPGYFQYGYSNSDTVTAVRR